MVHENEINPTRCFSKLRNQILNWRTHVSRGMDRRYQRPLNHRRPVMIEYHAIGGSLPMPSRAIPRRHRRHGPGRWQTIRRRCPTVLGDVIGRDSTLLFSVFSNERPPSALKRSRGCYICVEQNEKVLLAYRRWPSLSQRSTSACPPAHLRTITGQQAFITSIAARY